jgi:hypothetical protein
MCYFSIWTFLPRPVVAGGRPPSSAGSAAGAAGAAGAASMQLFLRRAVLALDPLARAARTAPRPAGVEPTNRPNGGGESRFVSAPSIRGARAARAARNRAAAWSRSPAHGLAPAHPRHPPARPGSGPIPIPGTAVAVLVWAAARSRSPARWRLRSWSWWRLRRSAGWVGAREVGESEREGTAG